VPETAVVVKTVNSEELNSAIDTVLSFWELKRNFQLSPEDRHLYERLLVSRLSTFTAHELRKCLENRLLFINSTPWFRDNPDAANSLVAILESDETVLTWLQMPQ
jgi:hypothetical protein